MPLPRSSKWVSGRRPTKEVGSNPKDELGMMKVPLGLVSPVATVLQALCMQDGDEKYGPYNYRVAKVQAHVYLEALARHTQALLDGEDFDLKTGKPHIGYVLATAQIYADAWINGFLIDTRPVPGKAAKLLNAFERTPNQPEFTPEEIAQKILSIVNAPLEDYNARYEPTSVHARGVVGQPSNPSSNASRNRRGRVGSKRRTRRRRAPR